MNQARTPLLDAIVEFGNRKPAYLGFRGIGLSRGLVCG